MSFSILLLTAITVSYALLGLGEFVGELLIQIVEDIHNKYAKLGLYLLSYLLSCNQCFSFWFSLFLTQDLLIAALSSIVITVSSKIIQY